MAPQKRTFLVVQLDEKTVTLATGTKAGNKLHYSNIVTRQLCNVEIVDKRIFNPTHIQEVLRNYATSHHMKNARLIVSIPFLHEQITQCALLQTILCLSKRGFIIDHLSQKPFSLTLSEESLHHNNDDSCPDWKQSMQTPNLLEHFLPSGYNTTPHLIATTSVFIFMIGMTISCHHKTTTVKLNNDEQEANALIKIIQELQGQVKVLYDVEKQNTGLSNKITTLTSMARSKHNPYDVLTTIAQAMPSRSKLVSLQIGKNASKPALPSAIKKQKSKLLTANRPFLLKGLTHDPEEISTLVKTLSKKFPHTDFSVHHSNKKVSATQEDTEPPFQFVIRVTRG